MNLIYLNKVTFPSNIPACVFSTFNAYGFAQNNVNTYFIAQTNEQKNISPKILKEYFGIKPLKNFSIVLFSKKIYKLKYNEIFYTRAMKWILTYHKKIHFDFLLTRDPGFLPFVYYLKAKTNIKIIYQSHNFYTDLKLRPDLKPVNKRKYNIFERVFIPKLNGLLTLQNPQKDLYRKYYKIPIFAGHPGMINIEKPHIKKRFKDKIISYIGSFQEIKGIELVIQTVKNTYEYDWKFYLIGGRNYNEIQYIKNIINKYNMKKKTKIIGWLNYNDLKKYISRTAIGLILLNDSFYNKYLTAPSKLFDYLSYGIPIIASDLPSIRDFIKNGQEGFLIKNPEDAVKKIKYLLTNFDIYKKISLYALNTAKKYTWKKSTNKMIEFMRML